MWRRPHGKGSRVRPPDPAAEAAAGPLHERDRQAAFLRGGNGPAPGATLLCAHVASSERQDIRSL